MSARTSSYEVRAVLNNGEIIKSGSHVYAWTRPPGRWRRGIVVSIRGDETLPSIKVRTCCDNKTRVVRLHNLRRVPGSAR